MSVFNFDSSAVRAPSLYAPTRFGSPEFLCRLLLDCSRSPSMARRSLLVCTSNAVARSSFPALNSQAVCPSHQSCNSAMSNGPRAKIQPEEALRLHREGKTVRAIAALFPGASAMAASRAIHRALGTPMTGTPLSALQLAEAKLARWKRRVEQLTAQKANS
jgi:hypothetical protein